MMSIKFLQDQLNSNIKDYSEIESLYNSLKEIKILSKEIFFLNKMTSQKRI